MDFAKELSATKKALSPGLLSSKLNGITTLFTPVTATYAMALGGMHAIKSTVDAQKIKKRNDLMLSLGIEQLPNGELLDSAKNVVQYDYEKGEIITPQLGQGPVKKLTRRGSR